ncbi:hypothetical protein, partial [Burkholderia vietnamiensis]|uniref:hypothetical protein n=1 Tax=Burkholderia vietnamiensis TaxID=60552 RepID=UPI001E356E45
MLRAECVFSAVCNMGFPYAYLMRPISLPENRRSHAGSNSAIAMQQHIDAIRTAQNICFFIRVSNDVEIKRLAFLRCVAFLAYRQIAVFAGPSSFRVEHNTHNDSWSSSPVGMCAG